ncbi:MAG: hypothetical protein FWH07_02930 [Oscillospiraceae bacterium]|nr:hypothetical protein [Oscillospiraceae bacterium]
MANGWGGKRPNSGRKKKNLADKLLDGNPGKQKITVIEFEGGKLPPEPPDYIENYCSKILTDVDGEPTEKFKPDADDIYRETVSWIEKTGCSHLINADYIFDYAIAKARWYECERYISRQGFAYVRDGILLENPVVDTATKYFKIADRAWLKIWDIVAQNCEHNIGGTNPHSDALAKLLQFNPAEV